MKLNWSLGLIAGIGLATAASIAQAGKVDDTLNVAVSGEAATMDNYKVASREGLIIARHLFDRVIPSLAVAYGRGRPVAA